VKVQSLSKSGTGWSGMKNISEAYNMKQVKNKMLAIFMANFIY
jgi:hypothetical protein